MKRSSTILIMAFKIEFSRLHDDCNSKINNSQLKE